MGTGSPQPAIRGRRTVSAVKGQRANVVFTAVGSLSQLLEDGSCSNRPWLCAQAGLGVGPGFAPRLSAPPPLRVSSNEGESQHPVLAPKGRQRRWSWRRDRKPQIGFHTPRLQQSKTFALLRSLSQIVLQPLLVAKGAASIENIPLPRLIMNFNMWIHSSLQSGFKTGFIAPKTSLILPLCCQTSSPSEPLRTSDLFPFPIVLPFPECCTNIIILYVTF